MTARASDATEAEVLLAARGDREAFARLVTATRSLVSSIALAELRDVETARDVAQDVYVQIWNDLGALRNPRSFLPFLRQVTRQRARRVAERRGREVRGPDAEAAIEAAIDPAGNAATRLLESERLDIVHQALDALPDDAREVVALYYLEGHSAAQVARLLGLREEAVHQRLSRARARLRAEVLERFGDALTRAAPGAAFTAAVLSALPGKATALAAASGLASAAATLPAKAILAGAGILAVLLFTVLKPTPGGGPSGSGGEGTVSIARPREASPGSVPSGPSPLAQSPIEGGLEVRVTAAGSPASGAEIRVYHRLAVEPLSGLPAWRLLESATAGRDGEARFPAAPGAYLVSARTPGFAPGQVEVIRPSGEATTPVDLALPAAVMLSGRTTARSTGEPVPLANVTLERESALGAGATTLPMEERSGVVSDPLGRFSLGGIAPGRYRVVAEAPGHARTTLRNVVVPHRSPLEVVLGEAGILEGRVVMADGHPAAGAEVRFSGGPELLSVTSGALGGFAAEVQPGSYRISAVHGSGTGAVAGPVAVDAGRTVKGLVVRLGAASSIAGRVLDRDGRPLADAQVMLSPAEEGGEVARAVTSKDGTFDVAPLAPGEYDLEVQAEGRSAASRRGLVVLPGQRFELEIRLDGVGTVTGTVRSPGGAPIAGANVRGGSMWGGGLGSVRAEAVSGSDGRYSFPAIEVGPVELRARRPGAVLGETKMVVVEQGRGTVADFVLPAMGTLEGEVRFTVPRTMASPVFVHVSPAAGTVRLSGRDRIEVGEDGRFRAAVAEGEWRVLATAADGVVAIAPDPVRIEAGETARVVLTLASPEDDPRRLVIEVLEPGGAPAARAVVALAGEGARVQTLTNDEGRARVQRPSSVAMVLLASKGSRVSLPVNVAPEMKTATVELQPATAARGRVVPADGVPPRGFTLLVEMPASQEAGLGEGIRREFLGDRYELSDLPSGPVRLVVKAFDGRAGAVSLVLSPGEQAERDIPLEAAARILVRPVDAAGKLVDGAYVTLGSRMIDSEIDGIHYDHGAAVKGVFAVEGVAAGRHELRIGARMHREIVRTVDVTPGQTLDLGTVVVTPLGPPGK